MSFNAFTSNSSKKTTASVFSLAILVGAAGLTLAEAIPGGLGGGAGFIVGFIFGFVFLSVIAAIASLPSDPDNRRSNAEAEADKLIQAALEILQRRKGTTEWK